MKTILVIGGAGYIGSHMVKELLRAGYTVVVLDNFSTGNRALLPGGRLIEGDLGDPELLAALFSQHKIDAVMHFAAFSLVGESVLNPLKYYRNNLAGTIELLDAMIRFNIKKFIFSSTAAVYGEPVHLPITETHPSSPTNPYGATKIAVERMLADCDQAHGLLLVAVAGYLVFHRREKINGIIPETWAPGLLMMVAAMALLLVGQVAVEYFVMRSSLIILMAGIIGFLLFTHYDQDLPDYPHLSKHRYEHRFGFGGQNEQTRCEFLRPQIGECGVVEQQRFFFFTDAQNEAVPKLYRVGPFFPPLDVETDVLGYRSQRFQKRQYRSSFPVRPANRSLGEFKTGRLIELYQLAARGYSRECFGTGGTRQRNLHIRLKEG